MFKIKNLLKRRCRSAEDQYTRYIRYGIMTSCTILDFKQQHSRYVVKSFLRYCFSIYIYKKAILSCPSKISLIVRSIRELVDLNKLRLSIVLFVFMKEFDVYK